MEEGPPDYASNVNNTETQEPSNTISTKVDYRIPGYNSGVTLAAGKRQPPCVLTIGNQLTWDNSPDIFKQMNRKGTMSFDFKFHMSSVQGQRSWCYNAFRHKWSPDNTYNNGGNVTQEFPTGTAILQPRYALAHAYEPAGQNITHTACLDGKNHLTMFAGVNLSDLEDMSYNLIYNKQALRPFIDNIDSESTIDLELPQSPWQHMRCSYPYYLNSFPNAINPNLKVPPQIFTGINRGVITYLMTNTNTHPCRVEVVVLRVKKTAILPTNVSDYLVTSGGVDYQGRVLTDLYETALGENYVKHGKRNRSTDTLGGLGRTNDDILTNPKVKFLANLSGEDASRVPFTEVSRQAMVLAAGDKRQMVVKLPGLKYNPFTSSVAAAQLSTAQARVQVKPFDSHCYYVAVSVNGLISTTRLINTTDAENPVAGFVDGSEFTSSSIIVEGNYKEYIQAGTIKEEFGKELETFGRINPDVYTLGQTIGRVPITILPQNDVVITATNTQILSDVPSANDPIPE